MKSLPPSAPLRSCLDYAWKKFVEKWKQIDVSFFLLEIFMFLETEEEY